MMNFDGLPDDCLAQILSFTSPSDACRVSLVSSRVSSAANSGNVWEKFLPSDYQEILSRLVSPMIYSSKKELFQRLCKPQLIDGGKKTVSLDISTCKKCYMLSARELSITWATNPLYWTWKSYSKSRFSEIVELRTICWLEIHGKINTHMLSPKTVYTTYLIVKFVGRAYGLDTLPSEVSLEVGDFKSKGLVYLHYRESKKQFIKYLRSKNLIEGSRVRISKKGESAAGERKDGWIEIELGSFYNDGGDNKEVKMYLKEVTGEHLKGGLIVEGLEIRPRY